MKKIILLVGLVTMGFASLQAQEVGITGGYLNVAAEGADEGTSGFYAGLYTEFSFSNTFHLQPELLYGKADDTNLFYLPVMLKYYVAHTDISLQVGPQATYIVESENDFKQNLGLDLAVGAGFDIVHNIFIEAKYGFKIAENSDTFQSADFNTFTIGIGIGL